MVSGALKGSANERAVVRQLSLWVSKGKSNGLFWRTRASGGFATVNRRKGVDLNRQAGDVGLLDDNSEEAKDFLNHYVVELKHIHKRNWWPNGEGHKLIFTFWGKIAKEARILKKRPLLIVKVDHCAPLLFAFPTDLQYVPMQKLSMSGSHTIYKSGKVLHKIVYVPFLELLKLDYCDFREGVTE